MPTKKLFVLANSIKKNHRCVAGREVISGTDGQNHWGGWIRPVSTHDEGAISIQECRLEDNCIPKPLDVIKIPCTTCENDPTQPENWEIQRGSSWHKITNWDSQVAASLLESPSDLWLQPGVKQDRVTSEYLVTLQGHQSLYLIKPKNFKFLVETKPWDGRKRVRGVFNYNWQHYDFSMTDPLISQKYFPSIANHPDGFIDIENLDDCFICVSITPEFRGYHYKLIATVFEI
jgi:hypothetical protein